MIAQSSEVKHPLVFDKNRKARYVAAFNQVNKLNVVDSLPYISRTRTAANSLCEVCGCGGSV